MSIKPGIYDFELQRRASYSLKLQFKAEENLIDLRGYSFYAQVWNVGRTTKYADFAVTETDLFSGEIEISLTGAQTTSLPNESYYDVLFKDPSGSLHYYLKGVIYASNGYSVTS